MDIPNASLEKRRQQATRPWREGVTPFLFAGGALLGPGWFLWATIQAILLAAPGFQNPLPVLRKTSNLFTVTLALDLF